MRLGLIEHFGCFHGIPLVAVAIHIVVYADPEVILALVGANCRS